MTQEKYAKIFSLTMTGIGIHICSYTYLITIGEF